MVYLRRLNRGWKLILEDMKTDIHMEVENDRIVTWSDLDTTIVPRQLGRDPLDDYHVADKSLQIRRPHPL